jgi:hypothetical protein
MVPTVRLEASRQGDAASNLNQEPSLQKKELNVTLNPVVTANSEKRRTPNDRTF